MLTAALVMGHSVMGHSGRDKAPQVAESSALPFAAPQAKVSYRNLAHLRSRLKMPQSGWFMDSRGSGRAGITSVNTRSSVPV